MNFFKMPKPRRFSYHPIYTDEREERLRRLEERAGEIKPEEGSQRPEDDDAPDVDKNKTAGNGIRFSRRKGEVKEGMQAMHTMQIVVIVIVLVAVWRILLSL